MFLPSSTAVSVRLPLPHPPLSLSLPLLLAPSTAWRTHLLCASFPVPPRHEIVHRFEDAPVPLLALLKLNAPGHNTVSTPNSRGELSVDPSVVRKSLRSSARHWAKFFFFCSAWPWVLPTSHRPKHHPADQRLIGRPLYAPRSEEASFCGWYVPVFYITVLCSVGGLYNTLRKGWPPQLSAT